MGKKELPSPKDQVRSKRIATVYSICMTLSSFTHSIQLWFAVCYVFTIALAVINNLKSWIRSFYRCACVVGLLGLLLNKLTINSYTQEHQIKMMSAKTTIHKKTYFPCSSPFQWAQMDGMWSNHAISRAGNLLPTSAKTFSSVHLGSDAFIGQKPCAHSTYDSLFMIIRISASTDRLVFEETTHCMLCYPFPPYDYDWQLWTTIVSLTRLD